MTPFDPTNRSHVEMATEAAWWAWFLCSDNGYVFRAAEALNDEGVSVPDITELASVVLPDLERRITEGARG